MRGNCYRQFHNGNIAFISAEVGIPPQLVQIGDPPSRKGQEDHQYRDDNCDADHTSMYILNLRNFNSLITVDILGKRVSPQMILETVA